MIVTIFLRFGLQAWDVLLFQAMCSCPSVTLPNHLFGREKKQQKLQMFEQECFMRKRNNALSIWIAPFFRCGWQFLLSRIKLWRRKNRKGESAVDKVSCMEEFGSDVNFNLPLMLQLIFLLRLFIKSHKTWNWRHLLSFPDLIYAETPIYVNDYLSCILSQNQQTLFKLLRNLLSREKPLSQ